MKKNNILIALLAFAVFSGCSDTFLERPPKDSLVDANFYKTDDQVLAGTAALYSAVWKDYIDQANFKLGDFRGGTTFRAWGDRDHVLFNTTEVSADNSAAYRAFYVVVGQANLAIQNINTYAGAEVTDEVKNHAIAEARFMRATAYTHLVSNYGAVPIIENNLDHLNDPYIKRNTMESVWEFITRDFEFAAENLSAEAIQPGRLTRWSAEGMLARTYLTRAGVGSGGTRNQAFLDKARDYAESVITNSGKSLEKVYSDLFLYSTSHKYDNNKESLFELQWVFTPDYAYANTMVSQITYSNEIAANGDGWGGDISATWWMLRRYDGLVSDAIKGKNQQDSIAEGARPGFTFDQRLKATYMLPGFVYPEITQKTVVDGETVEQDLTFPTPGDDADNSYVSIKKYVVGGAKDTGGEADTQRYPNNTYMLRLAEIYLIYAEAVLGNNGSTSDGKALAYFNAVHERAGLPPFIGALTWDDIFNERVKEFAMESMLWYDLVRLHYYNPEKAYQIINEQDRGLFLTRPNQTPNPTRWTFTKTSWFADRSADANSGNFLLPLPASEVSQAPSLKEEPVPYDFGN